MRSNCTNYFWNRHRSDHHSHLLNISVIIAVVIVYAVNTFFLKPNSSAQFLHCYLNDLFAMPFILAYTNLLIHWIGKRSTGITTPLRIGCFTVFCVTVWEGIAPMVLANSTRDIFDVVAYSFGSLCYFLVVLMTEQRIVNTIRRNV